MHAFSVRVFLVDDYPAVLFGLTHFLAQAGSIEVGGACHCAAELMTLLKRQPCDVIVMDYSMPSSGGADGLTLIEYLQRHHPAIKVVVFTFMDSPFVLRPLGSRGVSAIVSKTDAMGHLVTAIHSAYAGGQYLSPAIKSALSRASLNVADALGNLTPRETEVLRLLMSGLSVTEVAARLNRSKQTISDQRKSAMRKLGVGSNIELVRHAIDMKLGLPTHYTSDA